MVVDDIDHKGTVRVNDAIQPLMKEQGKGVILNISAITSVYNYPYEAAYVNAKHANEEDAATRAKESDAKEWGIRAYSIAPGDVYTSTTWDAYDENEKREIIDEAKQIVDVKEVVTSILMVSDLSRQRE